MSCLYCCWALEPSGDGKTKSYTTYNNAFILCLFECVFMFGCRQWVLYRNVLTGGEWEKSWRTVRVEVQIFFISTPTHTDRYKHSFLVQKMCARYLVEVYHEGTKADRNRLPALHAGKDSIHQTNLCLLCWHIWTNQSHKHDQTHLPKSNQTAVHKLDVMAGRQTLWCKRREMGHIGESQ